MEVKEKGIGVGKWVDLYSITGDHCTVLFRKFPFIVVCR